MQQTVLITGGSSGIGFELAKLFAADGYCLILVARDAEKLKQAADVLQKITETITIAADLSVSDGPQKVFRETESRKIIVDVLVNNAGFGVYGKFVETDLTHELAMIQTNVGALTALTKLYGAGMAQRRKGKILNVASTAAFQPGPLMAVYYATKAYVLSFSEAIANELAGSGVSVTTLCPGPTDTGFNERADMTESKLFSGGAMTAAAVAIAGYRGLKSGKRVVVPGWENKIEAFATRLVPRAFAAKMARSAQEKK